MNTVDADPRSDNYLPGDIFHCDGFYYILTQYSNKYTAYCLHDGMPWNVPSDHAWIAVKGLSLFSRNAKISIQ